MAAGKGDTAAGAPPGRDERRVRQEVSGNDFDGPPTEDPTGGEEDDYQNEDPVTEASLRLLRVRLALAPSSASMNHRTRQSSLEKAHRSSFEQDDDRWAAP